MSFLVGVTNARLSPTKRGVAVELAARLGAAMDAPVCLIGADPADRDVQRHLPHLVAAWGTPSRMQVARGPHQLEIASFARSRVCVVSVSDRESVELVLPMLQQRFGFLVVDAPSRTGFGVGIAAVLLDWLDALLIATGVGAGELAETRRYTERLDALPNAHHVDVRVLPIGEPSAGGLAHEQLDARLATLPTIGHVPRLGGIAPTPTRSTTPISTPRSVRSSVGSSTRALTTRETQRTPMPRRRRIRSSVTSPTASIASSSIHRPRRATNLQDC